VVPGEGTGRYGSLAVNSPATVTEEPLVSSRLSSPVEEQVPVVPFTVTSRLGGEGLGSTESILGPTGRGSTVTVTVAGGRQGSSTVTTMGSPQ
jgi:hypothetical protein